MAISIDEEIKSLKMLAPKWSDKEFVSDQLIHHFEEITELLKRNDPHTAAELIDLALIASRLSEILILEGSQDLTSEVDAVEKRFSKFIANRNK